VGFFIAGATGGPGRSSAERPALMSPERFALIVAGAHLAAASLHGAAHDALGIPVRGVAGRLFVAGAVFAGPLAALALLHRGRCTAAALLLSASMVAALGYGLAVHYVLATADNVARVPPGLQGAIFRCTAAIIALLEAAGVAAGAILLVARRGQAMPAGAGTSCRRRDRWRHSSGKAGERQEM